MEKKKEKFITFKNNDLNKKWNVEPISTNIDVETNLRYNKFKSTKSNSKKNKQIKVKDTFKFNYSTTSIYKAKTAVGNGGKGDGDININNQMWYPKSSRDSNQEFRKNIESFSFDRFQYLDKNPQKVGNIGDNLKRVGESTRKTKKKLENYLDRRKFNF
jgi:hypothetical protein